MKTETMVQNGPGDMPLVAAEMTAAEANALPQGHVARVLTFKDRHLILLACGSFAAKDKGGDYKKMAKLERVKKALRFEEVEEYFDGVEDAINEKVRAWTGATNRFANYEGWKSGMVSRKAILDQFPDLDLDEPMEKPPARMPRLSDEEKRGKKGTFHIPAKLDTFIEEALKEMKWGTGDSLFVVELATKYELPLED